MRIIASPEPSPSRKHHLRRILIAAAAVVVAISVVDELTRPAGPDVRTSDGRIALIARGDELRNSLERFRQRHGRYPGRLTEVDVALRPADRAFGGWNYHTDNDGRTYYLKTGRYVRDGFILARSSSDTQAYL